MSKKILLILFILSCINVNSQGTWTWKKGDAGVNLPSVFGTKGTPSATNKPAGRYECAEWIDDNGNFWLYGGGSSAVRYSDLWKFNPSTNIWTFMHGSTAINAAPVKGIKGVSAPANFPGGNGFAAATWTDLSGNLWLYGGDKPLSGGYSDLWKYNITSNQWTWMHGSGVTGTTPVYGTKGTASAFNTPGARMETSCTWVDSVGNLWLFGGSTIGPGDSRNDLWRYNITTNQWTWMHGSNVGNGGGNAGVYGTKGIAAANNTPSGRWCYSHWTDKNGDFWLFGGMTFPNMIMSGTYNDLWKYKVSTNQWTWVNGSNSVNPSGSYGTVCTPSNSNQPPGRMESRACWTDICGNFWLFGGRDNNFDYYNDLWKFSVKSNQWTWIKGSNTVNQVATYGTINVANTANVPNARFGSVGWTNESGFWLFGGLSSGDNNDLWLYELDSINSNFSFASTPICDVFTFADLSTFGCDEINTYQWIFGDINSGANNFDTSKNPTHKFSDSGLFKVQLIISNCLGGKDTSEKTIQVYLQPVAKFTFNPTNPLIGDSIQFIDSSINAISWLWDFGDGITSTLQHPKYKYKTTGVYIVKLTVTNPSGCSSTISITIIIKATFSFYLPNSFTPNEDGANDVFLPKGDWISSYNIQIFNRWGELIFESNDFNKGWDGKHEGEKVQSDTYVWRITVKSKSDEFKHAIGHVSLLR